MLIYQKVTNATEIEVLQSVATPIQYPLRAKKPHRRPSNSALGALVAPSNRAQKNVNIRTYPDKIRGWRFVAKKNDDLEAENHMEMKSSKKEGAVEKCVFLKDPV